jgi:hypothetical protein
VRYVSRARAEPANHQPRKTTFIQDATRSQL